MRRTTVIVFFFLVMLWTINLWGVNFNCTSVTTSKYTIVNSAIAAGKLKREALVIEGRASKYIDADLSAVVLRQPDEDGLIILSSTDLEFNPIQGIYSDVQREVYRSADSEGCVPVEFTALADQWALSYLNRGITYAVVCTLKVNPRQRSSGVGAVAFGWAEKPDNLPFGEIFTILSTPRAELAELIGSMVEDE